MIESDRRKNWARLVAVAGTLPARENSASWLLSMIERNSETEFGKRHSFKDIHSLSDFQKDVALHNYNDFAPDIERMADGEPDVLFSGRAVAFERTSGSNFLNSARVDSGSSPRGNAARLIPYSAQSLQDFRSALLPWLATLIQEHGLTGSAYWSVSPAMRQPETTSGGIPIGLADHEYLGEDVAEDFAALSAVPAWVSGISVLSSWRLATLYHLLRAEDLSFLFLWSPTFFLSLLDGLHEAASDLRQLLREGGIVDGHRLQAEPDAASRLESCLQSGDFRLLWPHLKLISAWADASAASYAEMLRQALPWASFQPKGLLCTEGIITVPDKENITTTVEGCGFLEFLDQNGKVLFEAELQEGSQYQVVMTTNGGLYRYLPGDQVLCAGRSKDKAVLRFMGRSELTSDLVGEKLAEPFVCGCLETLPGFKMLLPQGGPSPRYLLLLDGLDYDGRRAQEAAAAVESALTANPQYAYARRLGQLREIQAVLAKSPLEQYLAWAAPRLHTGLVVLKTPALCANREFAALVMQESESDANTSEYASGTIPTISGGEKGASIHRAESFTGAPQTTPSDFISKA